MSVSYNKGLTLTGKDVYEQIYDNQSIQILGNATGFLIGSLIATLLIFIISLLVDKEKNPFYFITVILLLIITITPIAINLFSYQKIKYTKTQIINSENL